MVGRARRFVERGINHINLVREIKFRNAVLSNNVLLVTEVDTCRFGDLEAMLFSEVNCRCWCRRRVVRIG